VFIFAGVVMWKTVVLNDPPNIRLNMGVDTGIMRFSRKAISDADLSHAGPARSVR